MCDFGISEGVVAAGEAGAATTTTVSAASTAATYASYASIALGAASAAAQAAAQKKAADYQAEVAKNNQDTADKNAEYSLQVGDTKAAAKDQQTAQMLGAERAGLAASGVDLDSGSALRLQTDTATLGRVDSDTIRANAARDAYGYRTQGLNYAIAAKQDQSAGNLDALGDMLSGASTVANKWAAYQNSGALTPKAQPLTYDTNANSNGWT